MAAFQRGGTTRDAGSFQRLPSGEIPALLHPNEAVTPLTAAGAVPVERATDGNLEVVLPGGRALPIEFVGRSRQEQARRFQLGGRAGQEERSPEEQSALVRGELDFGLPASPGGAPTNVTFRSGSIVIQANRPTEFNRAEAQIQGALSRALKRASERNNR